MKRMLSKKNKTLLLKVYQTVVFSITSILMFVSNALVSNSNAYINIFITNFFIFLIFAILTYLFFGKDSYKTIFILLVLSLVMVYTRWWFGIVEDDFREGSIKTSFYFGLIKFQTDTKFGSITNSYDMYKTKCFFDATFLLSMILFTYKVIDLIFYQKEKNKEADKVNS